MSLESEKKRLAREHDFAFLREINEILNKDLNSDNISIILTEIGEKFSKLSVNLNCPHCNKDGNKRKEKNTINFTCSIAYFEVLANLKFTSTNENAKHYLLNASQETLNKFKADFQILIKRINSVLNGINQNETPLFLSKFTFYITFSECLSKMIALTDIFNRNIDSKFELSIQLNRYFIASILFQIGQLGREINVCIKMNQAKHAETLVYKIFQKFYEKFRTQIYFLFRKIRFNTENDSLLPTLTNSFRGLDYANFLKHVLQNLGPLDKFDQAIPDILKDFKHSEVIFDSLKSITSLKIKKSNVSKDKPLQFILTNIRNIETEYEILNGFKEKCSQSESYVFECASRLSIGYIGLFLKKLKSSTVFQNNLHNFDSKLVENYYNNYYKILKIRHIEARRMLESNIEIKKDWEECSEQFISNIENIKNYLGIVVDKTDNNTIASSENEMNTEVVHRFIDEMEKIAKHNEPFDFFLSSDEYFSDNYINKD